MLKTVEKLNPSNSTVLLRVDFNVDLDKRGKIVDDFRMRSALPTIRFLLERENKVVIISHLGRPGGAPDARFTLAPIALHLQKILKQKVAFLPDCIGRETAAAINKAPKGAVLLLENLRFYPGEEQGDVSFARHLAEMADVYVNDAFSVSHRAHASVVIVPRLLPASAGLLMEKEFEALSHVMRRPEHPLCVMIGGAKMDTKVPVIRAFRKKADHILLGGAIANTVLNLKGIGVGSSLIDSDMRQYANEVDITSTKMHVPLDVVAFNEAVKKKRICGAGSVKSEENILDIGPETVRLYGSILQESKTIIWNGPMGFIEKKPFDRSTIMLLKKIARSKAFSVVGGGETLQLVKKLNLYKKISHVSTAGGAMLEFLSGKKLPGLEVLQK